MPPSGRKLAAILAADAVGYSALVGKDEDAAIRTLRTHFDALLPVIERHGGRLVDTAGDGFLAEFGSSLDAVSCAMAMQQGIEERNRGQPEDGRMAFRMGVHVGDIVVDGDEIWGDTVNVAARLEAMANPGGLLISQSAYEGVLGRVDFEPVDSGERTFKNIARPIRVWSWPQPLSAARAEGKPRVYVADFTGHSDQEAGLAADLGNELRAHLARLTGLEVVAERKDAHYLVEGSVRLASGRSRVFGRLTTLDGARQIWSDRFDQNTEDPFDVLDHCASKMSMSVRRRIAADDADRVADKDPNELSFEQLLAVAGCTFFKPIKAGWEGGGRLAEVALERDPDNYMALAMAASGLGCAEYFYGYRRPEQAVIDLTFERIEKALRENSRTDMLYIVQSGLLLYARNKHSDAITAARRALDLNPDYNMGYWMLGSGQVFVGDYATGAKTAVQAVEIDIRDPYTHLYSRIAGYGYLAAGQLEEAVEWFRKADHLSPGLLPNLCGLAVSRWLERDRDGAQEAIARLAASEPEFRVSDMEPLPFRDDAMWQHFVVALREAGAPA